MRDWIVKIVMLTGLLFLSGCSIDGTVTSEDGSAIAEASVSAVYEGETFTSVTDENGQYNIDGLGTSGDAVVTVSKDGYISQTQTTTLDTQGVTLDFILIADDVTTPTPTGNVSGMIQDIGGNPIIGAMVHSGNANTMTDAMGHYMLEVEVGEKVSITADKTNYAQNSRTVAVIEDANATLNLTLAVIDKLVEFDVANGATISTKGASVELGAASIVNEDGTPYTGIVTAKVTFNQVTSIAGRETFPGEYLGLQEDGTETVLQSYGFIDVTLEDANGAKLRLADGATATLTYPKDPNIETTPDTIPLWYYDTVAGIWVEDGFATYDDVTGTYVGTVSHFTTWNLDAKFDGAALNGCVEDANGARINDSTLYISMAGNYKVKHNIDPNGEFRLINAPSNQAFSLKAYTMSEYSEEETITLAPGEDRTMSDCLVIDVILPEQHSITGRLVKTDGTPIANQYLNIYNNDDYLIYVYTDENGYIKDNTFNKPNNNKITISSNIYIDNNDINLEQDIKLNTFSNITNIGTIEIKTTTVRGCVQMADGSTNFDSRSSHISTNGAGYDEWFTPINNDGTFLFTLNQDFQEKNFYAYTFMNEYTKSFSVIANSDTIDLGANCLILESVFDINKSVEASITTTNPDVFLRVNYDTDADYEYPNYYGDILVGDYDDNKTTLATFDLTKNGVYYIHQMIDNYNQTIFDGTISIVIDGVTHTVTLPNNAESYRAWAGFAIEVYQGEIKIIELNKESGGGEV